MRRRLHFAGYDFDSGPEGTTIHREYVGDSSTFHGGDRVGYRDVNLLDETGTVVRAAGKRVWVQWDRYPGKEAEEWAPNLEKIDPRPNPAALRRTRLGHFVPARTIPEDLRADLNAAIAGAGLDGNARFRKPGLGLNAATAVLADFGIELGEVVGWLPEREERTLTRQIDLAWTNEDDVFSPESIWGNVLVFMWHWFPTTNQYEVVAYVS